jgi:branched-chain amino acid transport system permease protein
VALVDLGLSIVKIAGILAYLYLLLKVLGSASKWVKILGIAGAFVIIQLALTVTIGTARIFNNFDRGLLFQAVAMAMCALGLNLIYGYNGQFSLGQWGFYGVGAYVTADVAYRWKTGEATGMLAVLFLVVLVGLAILGIGRFIMRYKGMPVLSQFTLYLIGTLVAGIISIFMANVVNAAVAPLFGTAQAPGPLRSDIALQALFPISVLLGGAFSAELAFLFGLPVLTLGSDYFGIATLGFSIVVNTLMNNSDTVLPFPEMRGGQGMLDIPQMGVTAWAWGFVFLLLVIISMRNLIYSSTGRAIISVREDETAAKAMGIDVASQKLLAFVVGSLFAGIGGAIYALTTGTGFLSPGGFDFLTGFNPLIIVVFGGLGSMTGTLTASFGWIFFLEGLLRNMLSLLGTEAPTWRFVLYPIALLLLMLLRPQGALGGVEWGFLRAPRMALRPAEAAKPVEAATSK